MEDILSSCIDMDYLFIQARALEREQDTFRICVIGIWALQDFKAQTHCLLVRAVYSPFCARLMLEKVASLFALEFTVAFSQAAVNGFTAYGFPKFVFSEMKDIHVVEDV